MVNCHIESIEKRACSILLMPGVISPHTARLTSVDAQRKKVPVEDRWSGKDFLHDFVFQEVADTKARSVEASWYYDVGSWDGLKKWLGSDYSLDKPAEVILSYHEWNPIGVDNEKK